MASDSNRTRVSGVSRTPGQGRPSGQSRPGAQPRRTGQYGYSGQTRYDGAGNAARARQARPGYGAPPRRESSRQRAARKRRKMIIFVAEVLIILLMVGILAVVFMKEKNTGYTYVNLDEEDLGITSNEQATEQMQKYWNIALFGVDAENESQLQKGARSDSMMIASINMETGDIKLVSIYRDTYLNVGNDVYTKANAAYGKGGGAQALKMLNSNLDMEISDFVTIGYEGLKEVIDGLGGVEIEVDEVELLHINNYQYSIAKTLGISKYTEVKSAGTQVLNGLQATAYCRIRYTKGDDFKRAERQREVIKAIEAKAKTADLATLTKVFNAVISHVHTSLKTEDILPLLERVADFRIVSENGFPQEDMRTVDNIGSSGSCIVPLSLESNTVWLHQFLFENEEYTPSETVKEYSKTVESKTAPYLN